MPGSSREHAALAPLQLGVKAVIAKSFARIHMANLINSGIIPVTFVNEEDYDTIELGDKLVFNDIVDQVKSGSDIIVKNETKGIEYKVTATLSDRQRDILIAGGLLNYTRQKQG